MRNRRLIAAPVAFVLAISSTAGAQTTADSVRRMDSVWVKAYAGEDSATADKLFAPGIVVTSSDGTARTRAQELADFRPGNGVKVLAMKTFNVGVNVYGPSVTLLGDVQWDLSVSGGPRQSTRRYTATYTRGGPLGWQMVALHFFPSSLGLPVAVAPGTGVEGTWQGALNGNGLRIVLEISKASDGLLTAIARSPDQGNGVIPVESVRLAGDSLHLVISVVGASYDGVLSADRARISGTFIQGAPVSLILTRTGAAGAPVASTIPPAMPSPFGLLLDVRLPKAPAPVLGNGRQHLIYELHLVNYTGGEMLLTKVEVLSGAATLATLEGSSLSSNMKQMRTGATDDRSMPPAIEAVVFIEVTLDSGAVAPTSIRHRLTARNGTLETAEVPLSAVKPIVIGSPLRGEDWKAVNGPGNLSGHRHALVPIAGRAVIAQRFAIDWLQVQPDGATFTGDPLINKSYRAYGAEILAVADGIIDSVKDSIPENVPGPNSRAVPITLETIAGNHIVQNIGPGQYAMYAHLVPGSLRVKAGDRVRKGQVIALLGNSGNSTEPHLHFQVMDGPSPLGAEGLPYVIDAWELRNTAGRWERRSRELPMQDAWVRFGSPKLPPRD